jgi:tRNA modification GTPase
MRRAMTHPTIYALATPPGRSAVAVVRISGPRVNAILSAFAVTPLEPRAASLRRVKDPASGIVLDQALVIYFPSPRSETGEDMAEFQLHGGRAIIASVLNALGHHPGTRMAEPGEFARRAFENGKLDLAEIEGLADLIDAETEGQRQQAMRQAMGDQSRRFDSWRGQLLAAMGLVEAAIDFADEGDVSERAVAQADHIVDELSITLRAQLNDGHRGEIMREGFRVVLAGPPNVGKSSLLNALARRDAAIVSAEAGTTRDVIDVRLDLKGLPVIVSDTAGLRETASEVEREGIRRTHAATTSANLIVWLEDATSQTPPPPELTGPLIQVLNKCDLLPSDVLEKWIHVKHEADMSPTRVAISAKTGNGLDHLIDSIATAARASTGDPTDLSLTRHRHRREIESTLAHLETYQAGILQPLEVRAEDLRLAASALGRLTGRIDSEDVLGEIFSRFCIGK